MVAQSWALSKTRFGSRALEAHNSAQEESGNWKMNASENLILLLYLKYSNYLLSGRGCQNQHFTVQRGCRRSRHQLDAFEAKNVAASQHPCHPSSWSHSTSHHVGSPWKVCGHWSVDSLCEWHRHVFRSMGYELT